MIELREVILRMREYSLKELDLIPKISGLYYLFEEDRLLYIGKAHNIRFRLKQHRVANFWSFRHQCGCDIDYAWNQITRIIIEPIAKQFLIPIENIMIMKFKPILNFQTRVFYFLVDQYLDEVERKSFDDLKKTLNETQKTSPKSNEREL